MKEQLERRNNFIDKCTKIIGDKGEINREKLDLLINKNDIEAEFGESMLFSLLKARELPISDFLKNWEDILNQILLITWNAAINDDVDSQKITNLISTLYISNYLSIAEFRQIIRYLYFKHGLDTGSIILSAFLLKKKTEKHSVKTEDVLSFYSLLGFQFPKLDDLENLVTIESEDIMSKIQDTEILKEKQDYIADFVDDPSFELSTIDFRYISHDISSKITGEYLKKLRKNILEHYSDDKKAELETIEELLENEAPLSLEKVLKPLIKDGLSLKPKTVSMTDMEKVPKGMEVEHSTRMAYSLINRPSDVEIHILSGRGIGHSGILVKTRNGCILMDFGMSVVNNNLPYWHPLLQSVDRVLLSHAHLDHSGGLPFLYNNCYNGSWFACNPTNAIVNTLLHDNRKILSDLYSDSRSAFPAVKALKKSVLGRIETSFKKLTPNKEVEILPNVMLTPIPASHIYGSVAFLLDFGSKKLLYTGDFNADKTALFKGATFPESDMTVFDGTYYGRKDGSDSHTLKEAINSKEKTIIPAFSLGRAQEMLTRLLDIKCDQTIHLVGMAAKFCKMVNLKGKYKVHNKYDPASFSEGDIVIAGGGMLQGGIARSLLDMTKDDSNTGVILCGYQAPGTLGWCLREKKSYVIDKYQQDVFNITASGHTSSKELEKFIKSRKEPKFMVHTPVKDLESTDKSMWKDQFSVNSKNGFISINPSW